MDGELREHFAVKIDLGVFKTLNEDGVTHAFAADSRTEADNPERTECTLLLAAVAVRMLTGLRDGLVCLAICFASEPHVPLRKVADLLVSTMPMDASLDAHEKGV